MGNAPHWAGKVSREKIRLLYERSAMGLLDEDLLDDVAYAMYERCLSIIEVTAAVKNRVRCPDCGNVFDRAGTVLKCLRCSWELPWAQYRSSYKGKQLFGGGAIYAFEDYIRGFPSADTPAKKTILIDRLIHECHKFPTNADGRQLYTRPAAINLIEGKLDDIIGLLESLAYGPGSVPMAPERLRDWREKIMSAQREGFGRSVRAGLCDEDANGGR